MSGMTILGLPEQYCTVVRLIMQSHEIEEFDAYIYIWRNRTIQIDGDLTLKEMRCLVDIMEAVKSPA